MESDAIPIIEFSMPGPVRDKLVVAVLAGSKTATTGLLANYEHENEPLPRPGERNAVIDSAGNRIAVIEVTKVRVIRLAEVDAAYALAEGEEYASVDVWRAEHEQFWNSPEMRLALDDPGFATDDDTLLVAVEFRLVNTL